VPSIFFFTNPSAHFSCVSNQFTSQGSAATKIQKCKEVNPKLTTQEIKPINAHYFNAYSIPNSNSFFSSFLFTFCPIN
jgi:hypothetical protein